MLQKLGFVLSIGMLIACRSAGPPTAGPVRSIDPQAVLNTTWQWVETVTPVETIKVSEPQRYTIRLAENGQVQAQFDCNSGRGTYEIDAGRLSFGPFLATRMACPHDTLDYHFMRDLQHVRLFFVQDGELFLDLEADGGTMRFRGAP